MCAHVGFVYFLNTREIKIAFGSPSSSHIYSNSVRYSEEKNLRSLIFAQVKMTPQGIQYMHVKESLQKTTHQKCTT